MNTRLWITSIRTITAVANATTRTILRLKGHTATCTTMKRKAMITRMVRMRTSNIGMCEAIKSVCAILVEFTPTGKNCWPSDIALSRPALSGDSVGGGVRSLQLSKRSVHGCSRALCVSRLDVRLCCSRLHPLCGRSALTVRARRS